MTFSGTVLISGLDILGNIQLTVQGRLVGLGIPVIYAMFILFGKQVAGRYHPLTILTYGFGFGALTLLPFQFFTPQPWPVPGSSWLWFAGLVGFFTILSFSVYTFGLGRLPASVASILAMAEIPLASVYAYLLLGERLALIQFAGQSWLSEECFYFPGANGRMRPDSAPVQDDFCFLILFQTVSGVANACPTAPPGCVRPSCWGV